AGPRSIRPGSRGTYVRLMPPARDTFTEVRLLVEAGLGDYQIADATGVPRSTVLRWRRRQLPPGSPDLASPWRLDAAGSYCYLLGTYLGDGHVDASPTEELDVANRHGPEIPGDRSGDRRRDDRELSRWQTDIASRLEGSIQRGQRDACSCRPRLSAARGREEA